METPNLKDLTEQQAKLADRVRELKNNKAPEEQIQKAVEELNQVKAQVEKKTKELTPPSDKIDFPKEKFAQFLTKRFFVVPSFEIYGGIAGLYDLGPPGCAIKANLLQLWRQHFVLRENMLEVDCTCVTPAPVFKASGHIAKFADLMVKDLKTGACYRADHLLEQHLDKLLETKGLDAKVIDEYKTVQAQADAYSKEEMGAMLKKYGVKAPDTKNDLSDPEPFNLMFATNIGPTGNNPGYLRPETAQGIFVNFKRLLEFNGGKLPFAAAQIGQAYRNEIAPRSGLLRVREFPLAEIEHFVNPMDKAHFRFSEVENLTVTLFPRDDQLGSKRTTEMTIGDAVRKRIIDNETLGYFIGRTHLFLLAAGIRRDRLRFRQHLTDEMAHYACDCWDAEIQLSYGWVECVGIADRSAFDLTAHANETGIPLQAFIDFKDGPRVVDVVESKINKGAVGKTFGKKAQIVIKYLEGIENSAALTLSADLQKGPANVKIGDEIFSITPDMVTFTQSKKRVAGQNITPGVIEPSFGIGRIIYAILEHAYYTRAGDEQRAVLALPPPIAPVKVSVLPLTQHAEINAPLPGIVSLLQDAAISFKVDDSGTSIGRRYARTDDIGVPFGITIDHQTLKDQTVTLRERDTQAQVRIRIEELVSVLQRLVDGRLKWDQVLQKYPKVDVKLDED